MANAEKAIKLIEEYLKQAQSHHAMLLYGEWGSGKSHFVRNELKEYLEEKDDPVVMIYATAAGFKAPDELMKRLVTAYVNKLAGIEENSDNSKKKKLLDAARGIGLNYLHNKAHEVSKESGFSFSLSDDTFLSLALSKKVLIVIDDLERRAFAVEHSGESNKSSQEFDEALFSILCRLVEEQGHKVLLIANNENAISSDIVEKLVWERIEFKPDPEKLVDVIVAETLKQFPQRLMARDQLLAAQRANGKCNARRLYKIKPLLGLMAHCDFFQNDEMDAMRQRDTLFEVLTIALEVSDGIEPSCLKDDSDWLTKDVTEEKYRKYKSLPFLETLLIKGAMQESEEISGSLTRFANRYHPQTQQMHEVLSALRAVNGRGFEDEDGTKYLQIILTALRDGAIDIGNVPQCLRAIDFLVDVDIATREDFDNAVAYSEKLMLANTSFSRSAIHDDPIAWQRAGSSHEKYLPEIDALREAALKGYEVDAYSRMMADVHIVDEYSAGQIARNADAWFGSDPLGLTAIPPQNLKEHILSGNVESLIAIYSAIRRMHEEGLLRENSESIKVEAWDSSLAHYITGTSGLSKMRMRWLNQLEDYLLDQR